MSSQGESPVRDSKNSIDELFGGGEEAINDHEDDFFASIQQNHPITPYNQQDNLRIDDINYPEHDGETGDQNPDIEIESSNEHPWPDQESHDRPQEIEELEFLKHAEDDENGDFFKNLSVPQPREVFRSSIDTTEHMEVAPQEETVDTQIATNEDKSGGDHSFAQALELGEEDKPEVEDYKVDDEGEYQRLPLSSPQNDANMDNDSLFNASPAEAFANKDKLDMLLSVNEGPNENADEPRQVQEEAQSVPAIQVEEEIQTSEEQEVAESNQPAEPQLESKLDELFPDDDVDFFQNLDGINTEPTEKDDKDISVINKTGYAKDTTKAETSSKSKPNESTDELVNKLADLDLELDDDLLLDDDFLEEPPTQATQAPAQTQAQAKPKYTPQQQKPNLYAQPPSQAQQQDPFIFAQNLAKSKKKSDAYDFPDELIVNKVKPAPRHAINKYAPSSEVSQNSIDTLNSVTNVAAPQPRQASSLSRSSSQSQAKDKPAPPPQQKKSFFEDFPDADLPKPKKAARAAAPVKAVNQYHQVTSPIQQQNQLHNTPPQSQVLPKAGNKPPPMNPYMPKGGTSPIFQQHVPSIGHSGIAKPGVNVPHTDASSNAGYTFPPTGGNLAQQQQQYQPLPHPPSMQQGALHLKAMPPPPNMYAPSAGPVPPVQSSTQGQQPSPSIINPPSAANGAQGNRRASHSINTNVGRSGLPNSNSPYVPNAGPYAPLNQPKSHNRTNSLVGGKGKEINPYAPMMTSVVSDGSPLFSKQQTQSMTTPAIVPPPGRVRGFSNARSNNIYKTAPKVVNPEDLVHRQFPIFNWSTSQNVAMVRVNKAYNHPVVCVESITNLCKDKDLYENFPGPLIKGKLKKKDILNWLDVSGGYLRANALESELLLNGVMTQLVNYDGDLTSQECMKQICLILNPNINFNIQNLPMTGGTANAYKLDSASINTVFALIQAGHIDKALEYAITKGDWSMALVLANFNGVESFARIASEYARNAFPFSKANNKVLHIMPILLKVLAGNVQSVVQDLTSVANEGDYADLHWRDIVSTVAMINTVKSKEFLIEFGKLLITRGNQLGGEISFILAGLPLAQQGFMVISSGSNSMYTQLYEYILITSGKSSPLPHLLPIKLKHASTLADYGLINESQKYIDYINSILKSLGNRSPFVSQQLIQEFQNLIMRLSELGSTEQGGWFGSKMSKVNLDKVWGQIDKFIAGDEAKPKSSDNGVFSKFSPATSRNTSTLDLGTLHSHVSPAMRTPDTFERKPPVTHHASYPLGSSGAAAGTFNSFAPPLVSQLSSTSVSKYAPPNLAANSSFQNNTVAAVTTPSAVPHTAGPGSDRYSPYVPPANNTSQFHPLPDSTHQSFSQSKGYSPSGRKNASYPYTNNAAQASTSSLGSIPQQPNHHHDGQSNSISSVISGDVFHHNTVAVSSSGSGAAYGASHEPEQSPAGASTNEQKEDEKIETIKESPELKPIPQPLPEVTQNQQSTPLNPPVKKQPPPPKSESVDPTEPSQSLTKAYPQDELATEQAESVEPAKPEPVDAAPPPPPVPKTKSAPPTMRANPYAPKSGAKLASRRNKYGPTAASSSSNKYGPASDNDSGNKYGPPAVHLAQHNEGPTGGKELEPSPTVPEAPSHAPPTNVDTSFGIYSEPQRDEFKAIEHTSSAPPMKASVPGIDDSFEEPSLAESTNILHTSQARPLRLNQGRGYDPMNVGSSNITTPGFVDRGPALDGFPIPGSPESTTRANSVFGGTHGPSHGGGGLFSSRLSQSQQSALYQQYEVQDDTVRDYVPVIEEEEDEDDDDADAKKKQKIAERETKTETEKQKQQAESAKEQEKKKQRQNKDGWLSGLFGKNDGKEKPTRAHLGNQNTFYYDEKHKRWLDKSRSIEEQLKEGQAPPPPPSMKKKPAGPGGPAAGAVSNSAPPPSSSASLPNANLPPAPDSLAPTPASGNTTGHSSLTTPRPTPKSKSKSKVAGGANLANAGLDDLLSLSEGTGGGGRKAKRAGRRGYVNMMDK